MMDYEQIAIEMIERLREKQDVEMRQLLDKLAQKLYKDHKWSKLIMEQRKKEKVLFGLRDYEEA